MADLKPQIENLVGRLAGGRGAGSGRPPAGSSPELRPGDTGFAEAIARLVAMPLGLYAREGAPLEIRVPWLEATLWFVPGEGDAEALVRDGVISGRIWTSAELMAAMAVRGETGSALRTLALAKLTVDGHIVEARPR